MANMVPVFFLVVALSVTASLARRVNGLTPPPTGGQPWPMPQTYQPSADSQILSQLSFEFRVTGQTCDILDAAIDRYFKLIFYPDRAVGLRKRRDDVLKFSPHRNDFRDASSVTAGLLTSLTVDLMSQCEQVPYLGMDEACELVLFLSINFDN